MRKIKRVTLQVIGGANAASSLVMLLIALTDRLDPVQYPMLCNLGLLFPVLLVVNLAFMVFWAFVKPRGMLISVAGLLLGYGPVRRYTPLNLPSSAPAGSIKVLSYNVWQYGGGHPNERPNRVLEYIKRQDADIVCLQEADLDVVGVGYVDSVMKPVYQFRDSIRRGGDVVVLFSKYPIHGKERIDYNSKTNVSGAFRVQIQGRTVIVINNHFESTGLNPSEKNDFKLMVKGELKTDTVRRFSKLLVNLLADATKRRAPEADAVARFIAYHRGTPMIVCGDFNDTPISYVHRTVGKGLTDCYVSTANGPGISYHVNGFYVRIDNLFCTDDFQPYACRVDRSIDASDHYPIYCWLKMRKKP